jgi:predicted dehydrogenase
MLNIGLIGHGRVAARHADALCKIEGACLWSVMGLDKVRASQFAGHHGACAINSSFIDLHHMLADPQLDAVIITTPDKQHASNILSALDFNKAILVEKPLCTNLRDAKTLIDRAQSSTQPIGVGYHLRWHDGLRKLAEACQLQSFGEIRYLKLSWGVSFFGQHKWRTDLKQSRWLCLTVLGTHLIDIARWFLVPLCGEIVHTECIVTNQNQTIFDEKVEATFTFESGSKCQLYCSIIHDEPFRLQLLGSKATVVGDDLAGEGRCISINQKPLMFEKNNPYVAQLKDFVQTVQEKRTPEVNLEEGVMNVKQLDLIWPDWVQVKNEPASRVQCVVYHEY